MTRQVLSLADVGILGNYDNSWVGASNGQAGNGWATVATTPFTVAEADYQYSAYYASETFFTIDLVSHLPSHAKLVSAALQCKTGSSTITDWQYTGGCYIAPQPYTFDPSTGYVTNGSWVNQGNAALLSPVSTAQVISFGLPSIWDLSALLATLQSDLAAGTPTQCIMFGQSLRNDITPTGVNSVQLPSIPTLNVTYTLANGEPFMADLL